MNEHPNFPEDLRQAVLHHRLEKATQIATQLGETTGRALLPLAENSDENIQFAVLTLAAQHPSIESSRLILGFLHSSNLGARSVASSLIGSQLHQKEILPDLLNALRSALTPEIKGELALQAGRLGDAGSLPALKTELAASQDIGLTQNLRLAIAKLGDAQMREVVLRGLEDDSNSIKDRLFALGNVQYLGNHDLAGRLGKVLADERDALNLTPYDAPSMGYARVCDVAIMTMEILGVKLSFAASPLARYTDQQIHEAREAERSVASGRKDHPSSGANSWDIAELQKFLKAQVPDLPSNDGALEPVFEKAELLSRFPPWVLLKIVRSDGGPLPFSLDIRVLWERSTGQFVLPTLKWINDFRAQDPLDWTKMSDSAIQDYYRQLMALRPYLDVSGMSVARVQKKGERTYGVEFDGAPAGLATSESWTDMIEFESDGRVFKSSLLSDEEISRLAWPISRAWGNMDQWMALRVDAAPGNPVKGAIPVQISITNATSWPIHQPYFGKNNNEVYLGMLVLDFSIEREGGDGRSIKVPTLRPMGATSDFSGGWGKLLAPGETWNMSIDLKRWSSPAHPWPVGPCSVTAIWDLTNMTQIDPTAWPPRWEKVYRSSARGFLIQ